jgi:hypothetical protein
VLEVAVLSVRVGVERNRLEPRECDLSQKS